MYREKQNQISAGGAGYIGGAAASQYQTAAAAAAASQYQADVKRQTEVSAEMAHLSRAVDMLGNVFAELADRLAPVRRQTGGQAVGKGETPPPEPMLCQMADAIRSVRKQVEQQQGLLHVALNELEL